MSQPTDPLFEAVTIQSERFAILRLRGELDLSTADQLRDALEQARAAPVERIVVDLAGLDFMDVSGASPLVSAAAWRHPGLALRHPKPIVLRLLHAMRLDRHVED